MVSGCREPRPLHNLPCVVILGPEPREWHRPERKTGGWRAYLISIVKFASFRSTRPLVVDTVTETESAIQWACIRQKQTEAITLKIVTKTNGSITWNFSKAHSCAFHHSRDHDYSRYFYVKPRTEITITNQVNFLSCLIHIAKLTLSIRYSLYHISWWSFIFVSSFILRIIVP